MMQQLMHDTIQLRMMCQHVPSTGCRTSMACKHVSLMLRLPNGRGPIQHISHLCRQLCLLELADTGGAELP